MRARILILDEAVKITEDGYRETLEYNIKHIKGDTPYKKVAKKLLKELK